MNFRLARHSRKQCVPGLPFGHSSFVADDQRPTTNDQRSATNDQRPIPRSAFTLIEVMLSLAILAGALAVLGEFARMGLHSARTARELTRAELLAESIMSEVAVGIIEPNPVQSQPVEESLLGISYDSASTDDVDSWVYSIDVQSVDENGLLAVTVVVQQDPASTQRPVSFSLVRWMPDPMLDLLDTSMETDASSTESSTTDSSTTPTGTP